MQELDRRDQATLDNVRRGNPGTAWKDVERLLASLGAERQERAGSRVVFRLADAVLHTHRVHGRRACGHRLVQRVRSFLQEAGVR